MSFTSLFTGSFLNYKDATGKFIETEPYEEGFSAHYDTKIKPHVDEFEKLRLEALSESSKRAKLSTIIMLAIIAVIGILLLNNKGNFGDYIFVIVVGVILAKMWIYHPMNQYKDSIKSKIFPNIFSFIGNYKYSQKCPDRVHNLEKSKIIPHYTIENSEDQIEGKYKEVDIDLFETNLKVKSGKNNTRTVFKGIIISLSMHKNFKGQTLIKKDFGKLFNWLGDKFSKLEKVTLEDPEFEKIFEVYSNDQVEARYLLTTAFMERLLKLKKSFNGQDIQCSFYDNKLLIMIELTKNMFEPESIYKAEDFTDDAKNLLKDMQIIFSIIDTLKLNQNIGM